MVAKNRNLPLSSLLMRLNRLKKSRLVIGSSGVGKSSLANQLFSNTVMLVVDVRKDVKGRHTTSSYFLYSKTLDYYLIDTPGFKGIETHQIADKSILFEDILSLVSECRFSDCKHQIEPNCAVKKALEKGQLAQKKWELVIM
ncbi:ribosome small subunit-dependent GTPase A [Streptococcus sp. ZJ100]|uniref:ribosome small subunit-dependent GTPase A n=1 Tax=Streptococcus handemini TaxID=3161188 RepID=UPI0032EAB294